MIANDPPAEVALPELPELGLPELPELAEVERFDTPGRGFRHRFASLLLRLGGWTIGQPPPHLDKYVVIAAPHTFWWDGVWMLAFAWWWGLKLSWMGKSSLARRPFGKFMRRLGLVPVDRSSPQGLVAQVAEQFAAAGELVLSVPPEGTRGRRELWKSGFYHIARAADVPICMSYLDYQKREAGFGPVFFPSGRVGADMDRIRDFYKAQWAKYPELFTTPRLREEDG